MSELAVITPSFAGDADLFAELQPSVLEHTSAQTVHHVIVPAADEPLFVRYSGPRCQVWTYPDLLPRRFVRLPRDGFWMNTRRPWLPIRGWILQQALKIAAAAMVDAAAVLVADSDVVLVRPTSTETFVADGQIRLYRVEKAVHAGMDSHIRWHQVARRLLGLAPPPGLPLPDYISPLNVWEPPIVRAMLGHIGDVTGRNWLDAFTSQLHISEFILYGLFVDEVLGQTARPPLDTTICHNYWERTPLDYQQALAFVGCMPAGAVGMMISSKSRTPREVRIAAQQSVRSDPL